MVTNYKGEYLARKMIKEANFSKNFSDSSQIMVGVCNGWKSSEIKKKFDDVISYSKV